MKKSFLISFSLLLWFNLKSQNYTFSGTMSREILENYLSKAITMQGLSDANSCYFPPCNTTTVYDPVGYMEDITMLKNINARFIGRAAGLWGGEWAINYGYFNKVGTMVSDINNTYSSSGLIKPIIQTGIFEIVTSDVNGIMMSAQVANAYGISPRNFNISLMTYSDYPSNSNHQTIWGNSNQIVPDMSKPETQMWFYYLATQYIDRGIEAIHFGQVEIMDDSDPNHTAWWDVLSKIRTYAASKNRGIILCDAHTKGVYLNNTNQLLFDFHSYPLRIKESTPSWGGANGGAAVLDYDYCGAIYSYSKGGQTFFGWHAAHLPYLVELDNYGITGNPNHTGSVCFPWGWDEITWFGLQSEDYRNKWLKYAYYRVKCLDENAFLEMPGRRGMTESGVAWPGHIYRAAMGSSPNHYRQENTINDLWNGIYNSMGWVNHNWTDQYLVNPPVTPEVGKNLLFVGNDKMFYIGTDSRIHGYVFFNGAWYTVSPSWAAQFSHGQNVSSQAQASRSLVASPDGSKLYYIGTDGFIYGFNILNIWDYTYFAFPQTQMVQQSLRALGNLVPSGNNRLYYIGYEYGTGNSRIHAFIYYNGQWVTTSPSWVANGNGTPINSQAAATNSLVLSPDGTKLYYNGGGFIYGFNIINDWSYTYFAFPQAQQIQQSIRVNGDIVCVGNTRIYYVGHEYNTGNKRIHAFIYYNGQWVTASPSWVANGNGSPIGSQAPVSGTQNASIFSVSPDGSRMAYVGTDGQLHGFNVINDWTYTYFNYPGSAISPTSDVVVRSSNEVFYIANNTPPPFYTDNKIHSVRNQQDYCGISASSALNPYVAKYAFLSNDSDQQISAVSNSIYPNPFSHEMNVRLKGNSTVKVNIVNINGALISREEYNLNSDTEVKMGGSLSPGMYFMELIYPDYVETIKIIKQ